MGCKCDDFGTGYNIKVDVCSKSGKEVNDIDFLCKFYTDNGCRKEVSVAKFQMAHVDWKAKKDEYFALLYDKYIGSGWLMCEIQILDPDPAWPGGVRPVTLNYSTGIYLGNQYSCHSIPPPPFGCGCNLAGSNWTNGYKVKFEKVDYIPEGDNVEGEEGDESTDNGSTDNTPTESTEIYYGIIRGLSAFNAITSEQLAGLTKLTSKPSGITNVNVTAGDTLVVVTNGASVMKDDGVGGKTTFETSIMGANGEDLSLDGKSYKVYGETFIVSGTTGFYVV